MDDWTRFVTAGLGVSGLLALAVVLILRGNLVPRSTLDMVRADKDRELETYRALVARRDELIAEQQKQIALLLDGNRTTQRVIEALPVAARLSREGGGDAMAPDSEE